MPSYFYICPHINAVVGKKCLLYKEVGKIKLLSQYLILSHFLLKTKFNQEMHTIACVYCLQQQLCEWPRC